MYKIYSADWCSYCVKAKHLLESLDKPFEVIDIEGLTKEDIVEGLGFLPKTIPQVLYKGELLGGYTELVDHLEI